MQIRFEEAEERRLQRSTYPVDPEVLSRHAAEDAIDDAKSMGPHGTYGEALERRRRLTRATR